MDSDSEWISVKEAAAMAGYTAPYFRDVFCGAEPLVRIRVRDTGKRRRILVSRAAMEQLVSAETTEPKRRAV